MNSVAVSSPTEPHITFDHSALTPARVDPRIERTRLHVLETVRRMLAEQVGLPLTFSSLSAEARVSRRTLYTHWGTIETIIRDGVLLVQTEAPKDLTGLSQRDRLSSFVRDVARNLEVKVSYLAITSLLREAAFGNAIAAEAIAATRVARTEEFRATIGPITDDEYAQIVGPILMHRMIHGLTVTEEFIQVMIDHGCTLLGYDKD